ncbi:hypothetical protein PTTG_27533 [Puccinia triticina 1-1 BBBD Race 1]|uniref:Helicase ATP-binding domain-containing protein n=1 Tax=Puccinia triticina (isolate 1-1 / race 1 (BBBD)) TaxID=630390 RepID=A0A180GJY6_PUCT1|nr:hypothetical protein PTTG_27533 [Puccinia triticina 1-1 BBBD Race 1]
MKVPAFVVSRRGVPPELRGCVFSRAKDIHRVQMAFRASNIDLTPMWNYNPSVFFDIPQVEFVRLETHEVTARQPWVTRALCQCRTALKPHELTALLFLRNNKTADTDPMVLWNHPTNAWICSCVDQTGFNPLSDSTSPRAQGSILADNMGLGKTLTALAFILSTFDSAVRFMWETTLTNWESEINIHFEDQAITYHVFHRPHRNQLTWKDFQLAHIVLTTYEMIGTSGNRHPNQYTIESLDLCWYRIVLEEAHLMRNPAANRTLNIQQLNYQFLLCLTGTPVQNCLTDLQSLITTLKMPLWDNDLIWKSYLIPRMNVGAPEGIRTLLLLMQSLCLRRTKDVLLQLPQKLEQAVVVQYSAQWERHSQDLHESFIQNFGRLRTSKEQWDGAEFFRQLTMLRQFCNHPVFARVVLLIQPTWRWQNSGKIVHLIDSLLVFFSGGQEIERPKAVVFSSFVGFLEIVERALQESHIGFTWLTRNLKFQKRDENLKTF